MESIISVVIPAYNCEKYLRQCVDSVLKQTYKNIEIILVNDGSTDGTAAICDECALKNERIKVIHKENQGLAKAVIDGVGVSKGEYIGFVDSDDYIAEEMYATMLKTMKECSADIVQCMLCSDERLLKSSHGAEVQVYEGEELSRLISEIFTAFQFTKPLILPSRVIKLVRGDLVRNNIGYYDGDVSFGEDLNFSFAVLSDAKRAAILPNAYFYYYRPNGESITHNYRKKLDENNRILIKALRNIEKAKKLKMPNIKIYEIYLKYSEAGNFLSGSAGYGEMYRQVRKIGDELEILSKEWYRELQLCDSKLSRRMCLICMKRKWYGLLVFLYKSRKLLGKHSCSQKVK